MNSATVPDTAFAHMMGPRSGTGSCPPNDLGKSPLGHHFRKCQHARQGGVAVPASIGWLLLSWRVVPKILSRKPAGSPDIGWQF